MTVNLIVAISENNAIGKNGDLCFHIKDDLRRFKELTIGKPIIMGYNTYKSLPNGALPKRENIVLCDNKVTLLKEIPKLCDFDTTEKGNVILLSSLEKAIRYCNDNCYDDIFIIGGGMLYKYAIEHDLVDILYITKIHEIVEDADTFFPTIDYNKWNEKTKEDKETEDGIKYSFVKYKRNKVNILLKEGWKLNENEKIVKSILKRCDMNEGLCPCHNDSRDKKCPCSNYIEENKCCCGLYIPYEVWKPINGFENYYEISNFGKVKSLKRGLILKQFLSRGYLEVHLRKPGIKIHKKIHRLVAEHFLENPNMYVEVNHKDENKTNNIFTNLEWCTRRYNMNYNNNHIKIGKKLRKAVVQYDLDGKLIREYSSQTEASQITGIKQGSISDCIRKHSKTAGGYIWKLKE